MIVELKEGTTQEKVQELSALCGGIVLNERNKFILITTSKQKKLMPEMEPFVERLTVTDSDIQLASKKFLSKKRKIKIGDIEIGEETQNTVVITGPCSVESKEQIEAAALFCQKLGVKILRAGAFKPRTSPYSFQGLGIEGLKLLDNMRLRYGLKIVTEVKDYSHVHEVIEYADMVQIGAKAMYDQGVLRACSKIQKPVLLKRGFGSTLQEFVQAAEFVLSGGNPNVVLCERGIRTFETKTRFTLDLCGVAWLKQHTNLPIVIDPSHAMGLAYGVADLARAAVAMGIDGVLIETHPNPIAAHSDAEQQLNFEEFTALYKSLHAIANAVGFKIV